MREEFARLACHGSQEQRISRDRGARVYQAAQKRTLVLLFLSGHSSISRIDKDNISLPCPTCGSAMTRRIRGIAGPHNLCIKYIKFYHLSDE